MRSSRYIKVDKNVLLEWIYDDDNFIAEDYRIVIDTLKDTRSFSQNENTDSVNSVTNNTTTQQLFNIDQQSNKWGIVDPDPNTNRFLYLQYQEFSGNVPFRYDIVRLHFPIGYTFEDKLGVLLNINLYNQSQNEIFPLSNFYYDKTDINRSLELELTAPPFLFQEILWGKYLEIQIPSAYAMVSDTTILDNSVKIPRDGSRHKNLVEEDINRLSNESPILLNFQFLTKREKKLNQVSYLTTTPFKTNVPVVPEFEELGVDIQPSNQGDYFEIFGTFNSNISEFNTFINNAIRSGRRYYATYQINVFEKNIQTTSQEFYQDDNFDSPIDFRPIIKFSTTTATIDVTLRLVDSVDGSALIRRSTYSMLQDEVSKYSTFLSKINVKDTYKPKVYNNKSENISLNMNGSVERQKVEVPFPVFIERYNINTKNINEEINDTTWFGIGQQQILLYPSDNIIKFAIGKGTDNDGIIPLSITTGVPVFLQFKSDKKIVEVPLYFDGSEVNLTEGIVVFRIMESQIETIREIKKSGFDQFYILSKPDTGINTVIYAGRFLIYNE